MENLHIGLTGEASTMVTTENTAVRMGSGKAEVFATPAMVALIEEAAIKAADHLLPEGSATVGTHIDVRHVAATPIGLRVRAEARLIQVQGRQLFFRVEAHDEREKIGEGLHERFVIDTNRFLEKAARKAAR
jgi:fluoroacetyl-CoA thioesterase